MPPSHRQGYLELIGEHKICHFTEYISIKIIKIDTPRSIVSMTGCTTSALTPESSVVYQGTSSLFEGTYISWTVDKRVRPLARSNRRRPAERARRTPRQRLLFQRATGRGKYPPVRIEVVRLSSVSCLAGTEIVGDNQDTRGSDNRTSAGGITNSPSSS